MMHTSQRRGQGIFFCDIFLGFTDDQLMVNWWFGLVVWIPFGSPYDSGMTYLGVSRFESQTTKRPKPVAEMKPKCAGAELRGDWFSKLLYQRWLPSLFQHCLPTFAASYSLAEYWEHGSGN